MSTTAYIPYSPEARAAALAAIGATAMAQTIPGLLEQVIVATANGGGGGGGTAWGAITGTLSNQTDLQDALNLKLDATHVTGGGVIATGGFTLTVPATGTAALLATVNTFTARQVVSVNGAASAPVLSLTGTVFTGGTATTTKPSLLIEPTGTTSTGWSTSGTLFGVNAPSGFAGILFEAQTNGTRLFCLDTSSGGFARINTSLQFGTGSVNTCGISVHASDNLLFNSDNVYAMKLYGTGLVFDSAGQYGISNGDSYTGTPDIGFARTSAGVGRISDGSSGRGTLDAAGYQVGGTAGASFSGAITNLTVVNGIVTAAS